MTVFAGVDAFLFAGHLLGAPVGKNEARGNHCASDIAENEEMEKGRGRERKARRSRKARRGRI